VVNQSTHQVGRTSECVSFATASLTVAEDRGRKPVHRHINQSFDTRMFEDVFLTGFWLEDHVESERLELICVALLLINLKSDYGRQ